MIFRSNLALKDIREDLKPRLKQVENKTYYRIANPDQLAVIGASFLDEFNQGVKSFAIASTNYKSSQQRTVLGVASYFDHLFDLRILIISDSPYRGVFADVVNASSVENVSFPGCGARTEVHRFFHHFDLIDLGKALNGNSNIGMILESYDIVLWDTPVLSSKPKSREVYEKIAAYFDSLSIIVSPQASNPKDLKEISSHFGGYGINVNGLFFKERSGL